LKKVIKIKERKIKENYKIEFAGSKSNPAKFKIKAS